MNFYKRFIGDIQAKTGGLTLAEFGAYDRLLDHYYSTELPVPQDEVYRICRAMSASERASVDKVLSKFFELTPDGYAQGKADDLIAKAQPLIAAARENGKKGGRPKKEPNPKPSGFPKDNQTETQLVKALQSQSQISPNGDKETGRKRPMPPRPDDVAQTVWDDWVAHRKAKRATVTDTVLAEARTEAGKAGISLERFLSIWCSRGSQGLEAHWLRADDRKPVNGSKHTAAAAGIFGDSTDSEVIDV